MKQLKNNYKIDSFLKYILNNINNNISIEGYKSIIRNAKIISGNLIYIIKIH